MQTYAGFAGDRAVSAPLTWGQNAIWKAIVALAPGDAVLNQQRQMIVPDRAAGTVTDVATAVGALVSRHESLRTLIRDVNGEPRQEVIQHGQLPLTIVDCHLSEVASATDELAKQLAQPRFDYAQEWPLRVGLVVAQDRVRRITFAASHAAMDAYAADVVLRELRFLLLRGAITAPVQLQPVDLAQRESDSGAKVTTRAIAYWLDRYEGLPASMFEPANRAQSPRYQKASLTSPAADLAVLATARRHRVSSSTVLMAAAAGLIAVWTGHRRCGLLTIAGNRLQPGHEGLVAPTNQLGLVALEVDPAESFSDFLPRVWKAALQGYRHAYCDPVALNEALEAAGRSHGAETQPGCLFNDVRQNADNDTAATPDDAHLRAAREGSTLTWPERFDRFNWQFFLEVQNAPSALNLRLAADTACLSPAEVEQFLHAMDRLLVDAALQEVRFADFARH